MRHNRKVFKWISKLIILTFIFNICFIEDFNANAYSITSRLIPPFIKLNNNHYTLSSTGVHFNKSLHVSLPERYPVITFKDININGIGFDLSVKRIYSGKKIEDGYFGKGWRLDNYEEIKSISKEKLIIIGALGKKEYHQTDSGVYMYADGSKVESIGNGQFKKTTPTGVIITYLKNGKIESKKDKNDNLLSYLYRNNMISRIVNDGSGRTLRFFYNSDKLVKQITDDIGRTISFSYDKNRCLIRVSRFNVQSLLYGYDSKSRLNKITDKDGAITQIEYANVNDHTIKKIISNVKQWVSFDLQSDKGPFVLNDHLGNRFVYDYQYANKVLTLNISSNSGLQTTYEFTKDGKLLGWISPQGYQIMLNYDSFGRIIEAADTNGIVKSYAYEGIGNFPTEINDSRGPKMKLEYDDNNNIVKVLHSGQDEIIFDRNHEGMLKRIKLHDYIIKSNLIDKKGNILSSKFGGDTADKYFHDKIGRITKKEAGNGSVFEYEYNAFDKITKIIHERRKLLNFTYNIGGDLTKIEDSFGREIIYELNSIDGTARTILPNGSKYSYKRVEDKSGIIDTYTYPNKVTKKYKFNLANQLTEITDSFNNSTKFYYLPEGLLKKKYDPDGNLIEYFYDSSGRLTEKKYSDGSYVLFRYRNGNFFSIKTPDFHQEYSYNENLNAFDVISDRMLSIKVKYTHNKKGKISSIDISGVGKIKYTYDKNNRLIRISDPDSNITQYYYDKAGRVTKIKYPNGVTQTRIYNKENLPISVVVSSRYSELFNEKYFYGDDGLVYKIKDNITNSIKNYTYNKNDALVNFERETKEVDQQISYFYDKNNNLRQEINGKQKRSYSYDGVGRLIKSNNRKFKYDKRGNRISSTSEKGQILYEYDIENRLKKVLFPDGSIKEFRYDHRGRIIFIKYRNNERHILWNGDHRLVELDKNGKLLRLYVYGETLDELISVKMDETHYLHQDPLGSVRLVTNAFGKSEAAYEYLPFGKPLSLYEGKKQNPEYLFYAGRPYDSDLDLYYMRARFYSADLKQFLTRDPLGGTIAFPNTMHPYLYAFNNPLNMKDPSGEIILSLLGVAGVTIFVAASAIVGLASTMPSSGLSSYRQGEEYGSDPGRTLRNKSQEMKDFGDGLEKYVKPLTQLGGKGMDPTPYDIRDITDPDVRKADAARVKSITELIRPDKLISQLGQVVINEKIKEIAPTINGNPVLEKITGDAVKEVVEGTRKSIPGTTISQKPKPPEDPPKKQVNPPKTQEDPPKKQVNPPKAQEDPPKKQVNPPKKQVNPPKAQEDPPKTQEDPPKKQVNPPKAQEDPPKAQEDPPKTQEDPSSRNQFGGKNLTKPGRIQEGDIYTTKDGTRYVWLRGELIKLNDKLNDNPFDENYNSRNQLMASNEQDRQRANDSQNIADANLNPDKGGFSSDGLENDLNETQDFVNAECNERKPCPVGYACEDGKCVEKDDDCINDTDCRQGFKCTDGKCIEHDHHHDDTIDPKPPGDKPECSNSSQCSKGYICKNGHCVKKQKHFDCRKDSKCKKGYRCDKRTGKCIKKHRRFDCRKGDKCKRGYRCNRQTGKCKKINGGGNSGGGDGGHHHHHHNPPSHQPADGCAGGKCCKGHQLYCTPYSGGTTYSYPRTALDKNLDWICDICKRPFKTKHGRLAPGLRGARRGDVNCRTSR